MKRINIKQTDKFKDTLISLRFASNDLDKRTSRALLAMMLLDRTEKYSTKVLMNEALDNMYGANKAARVLKYGEAHVIELLISVLNEHYVDENLLDKQLDFLQEVIYHPLLDEAVFKEAKDSLRDLLKRNVEDPANYTIQQGFKAAGREAPLALSAFGDLETLEHLTLDDIKATYQSLLTDDVLIISVVGDVDDLEITTKLNDIFTSNTNSNTFNTAYLHSTRDESVSVEQKKIEQSYFSLVYNTHTHVNSEEYWASQLAVMMLGQLSSSFLFTEIREKRSLSYSTYAAILGYDAVMVVTGGVKVDALDEAVSLSKLQVERLKNHDFEAALLDEAKVMMKNQIIEGQDDNAQMMNSEYRKIILDNPLNSEEIIELIDRVTEEQIVDFGKRLEFSAEFRLEGERSEENN